MTQKIPSLQSVLEFDGQNAQINLGKKPEFKIPREITLEAWIYCEAQVAYAGILSNIYDSGATESGYGLLLDGESGIFLGLKTSAKAIIYLSSKTDSLKLNQWHHIAGTYDGKEMKVYIDGVEKASQAISDSSINYEPENDLAIGMYKDDNETYRFKGKIAEVRLWQLARTEQEIQENMNFSLKGDESGLVGYWPLNEGKGNTVYDKTNHGNSGTVDGANWVKDELSISDRKSNLNKLGVDKKMATKKEEKTPPTSSKTQKSKTESKKTSPEEKAAEAIKCSSSATGLEDYGFWCEQVKKERAARTEPDPPFRRGRIWA